MTMRKILRPTTIVLIVFAVGLIITAWKYASYLPMMHDTPEDVLYKMGYYPIIPPSQFYGPGTFNTVEKLGDGTVALHPLCKIDKMKLKNYWEASPTTNRQFLYALEKRADVKAKILSQFASSIASDTVQNVKGSYSNSKIILMPKESLIKIQKEYLQGSCEEAVEVNLQEGGEVCQSVSVIQANIVYEVIFNDKIESDLKSKLIENTKMFLGSEVKFVGDNKIMGDDLFFAVKLSKHCLTMKGEKKQRFDPLQHQTF
jgi:hypothetical protein